MAIENTNEAFKPYYDSFMRDLDGLLRIPSILDRFDPENLEAPFGKPIRESLDYMGEIAKRDGFNFVNVDNYCGFMEWGEGEKTLLIMCHLDVVPTTGEWNNPPFEPVVDGDKIYARGSIDDKGPLMATYYALKMLKDSGFKPSLKIRFFLGCDEESGSRCLERYIEKYGECDYGFSPDADFPCIYAEKGISSESFSGKCESNGLVSFKSGTASNIVPDYASATVSIKIDEKAFEEYLNENSINGKIDGNKIEIYGKAQHGSIPEQGVNAATYLGDFLNKFISNDFLRLISEKLHLDYYGEKLGIACEDDEMGKVSSNNSIYDFKEDGTFKIVTNIRYPKNFDFNSSMSTLEKTIEPYGARLDILSNTPVHYVPKYSHLVQALLKAYREYTQDNSEPISIGGGTYARDFKNAVAFGICFPGQPADMHMPNEYAFISLLIKGCFIYQEAIRNLCD